MVGFEQARDGRPHGLLLPATLRKGKYYGARDHLYSN